ncbi:MAG TPA: hypothetical protein V6D22_19610 [Candidatus Obscuribacterales bacterium]
MKNRCYGLVMSTAFLGAVLAQVYVPWPDWRLYLMECAFFAFCLSIDAINRRAGFANALGHTAAALVLAPLVIPRWYAHRPLKPHEWRKGGADANFYLAFGILTVFFTGISAASNFVTFGPERGFELIVNSGFAVAGTALVLSLLARQDRVSERGPSPAANAEKADQ